MNTGDMVKRYIELRDHVAKRTKEFEAEGMAEADAKLFAEFENTYVADQHDRFQVFLHRFKVLATGISAYKAGMVALENTVSQQITDLGGESIKTEHGTAYHSEIMSVKVANREEFMRFVMEDQREEFLTSAVSKEAVKDWIEKYQALPPGIDVTKILKTNFRRA